MCILCKRAFSFLKYLLLNPTLYQGFPDSSVGKESTCSAGDPSLIPGLGRSAGERIGQSLQSSWTSLVAQLVKNLPTMWVTWVRSLDWEDPLEEGMATHSRFFPGESPWTEEPGGQQSMESQRVGHHWVIQHNTAQLPLYLLTYLHLSWDWVTWCFSYKSWFLQLCFRLHILFPIKDHYSFLLNH